MLVENGVDYVLGTWKAAGGALVRAFVTTFAIPGFPLSCILADSTPLHGIPYNIHHEPPKGDEKEEASLHLVDGRHNPTVVEPLLLLIKGGRNE